MNTSRHYKTANMLYDGESTHLRAHQIYELTMHTGLTLIETRCFGWMVNRFNASTGSVSMDGRLHSMNRHLQEDEAIATTTHAGSDSFHRCAGSISSISSIASSPSFSSGPSCVSAGVGLAASFLRHCGSHGHNVLTGLERRKRLTW